MIKKSAPTFSASISYGAVLGQVLMRRRQSTGGIHQKVIADALGITQSAYSKLEAGQSTLILLHLRQIARRLGTSPHELLEETDRYVQDLESQGLSVSGERFISAGEVLIGLGILAALFAAAGGG